MRRLFIAVAALLALMAVARGQVWIMSPANQGGIGNATHPPPPVACTNQLVLNYSNSCALIGQAWGE